MLSYIIFVLKSLMEHNSSCLVEKNSNGLTPFHIAIQQGKLRLVLFCFQTLSLINKGKQFGGHSVIDWLC